MLGQAIARAVGNILFRDEGVHPQIHEAFALVALDGLALGPGDGLTQHLDIEVIADSLHVAVLAVAQQTACSANL